MNLLHKDIHFNEITKRNRLEFQDCSFCVVSATRRAFIVGKTCYIRGKLQTMKRFLTFLLIAFTFSVAVAQSRIYRGNSTYSSDILYSCDGRYLYKGNSGYSSDILFTFDGKYLYDGKSTYSSDVLLAFDGRYIYAGRSSYNSDVLFTFDGKYLYKGRSTYSSDILLTFDGKHVYKGLSTYSSDILFTLKGIVPLLFIVCAIFG